MLDFKTTIETFTTINSILSTFGKLLGLNVNKQKSIVWFSIKTPKHFKRMIVDLLGIQSMDEVGKYLGTYIDDVIDKT